MQSKIDPNETEEHLKNVIRDFLLDAYYKGDYEINVKDRKDLVIHNGPKTSDPVGVIIEAKSIKNTAEMVTKQDLNKKALRELILYYLREREDFKNISIKQLIITNATEWFIFDANQFEKLVYRNVKLMKSYREYKLGGQDTRYFYDEIAKPFIEDIKDVLEYTWFDITTYKKVITNDDKGDDKKLVSLFKLLSPTHILKKSFSNDSNSLNRNFYNELLHIIGLEEVSDKGKKVIQRKTEENREPASLLENTINILKYDTNVVESKHFDTALELCITWINRVLFLKLLESQLITYNKRDDSYRFLDYGKLKNYDALNKLFFQVLAIRPEDRRPTVQAAYAKVPYLNSSLFEVSAVEARAIRISGLEDDGQLSIYSTTVLKGEKGKRAKGEITTLEYLFRFLEAYNFSSEGGEQIQEENKSLINASVLGLIFEKINGYKDGSFFTPGFITMYMCSETIRRSIMQKFRDQTDYDSEDWGELKNYIGKPYKKEELQRYNALIDSIKICDPAVGSGHFLVSALNEIIAIKSELKILCNTDYAKLDVIATVDNDELILENDNADHTLYEYDFRSAQSQMVQQAIFHEKKKIIENCLFGVDINPNSVKICRLRLWIELLKSAYYTEESKYTDLETLPNIDINIKCGNSLISRFDLNSDLKPALKKSKFTIDAYKLAVQSYKQATDKEEKREFKKLIQTVKSDFKSDIFSKDKIDLQKLEGQFYERFGTATLIDVELTKAEAKKKTAEQKKLIDKIDKKKSEIEETQNNKIYENAFEWRFEFPEVLDDDGVYVGFDVVIGNPPYGATVENVEYYKKKYEKSSNGQIDTYKWFIELMLKLSCFNATCSYITSDSYLEKVYFKDVRKLIVLKSDRVINLKLGDDVFEEVNLPTAILLLRKSASENIKYKFKDLSNIDRTLLPLSFYSSPFLINVPEKGKGFTIKKTTIKLENYSKLSDSFEQVMGVKVYQKGKGKPKQTDWERENDVFTGKIKQSATWMKFMSSGIKRYNYEDPGEYINYGPWLAEPRDSKYFAPAKVVVREVINPRVFALHVEEEVVVKNTAAVIISKDEGKDLYYLLAILNSKLITNHIFEVSPKSSNKSYPSFTSTLIKNIPIPTPIGKLGAQIGKLAQEVQGLKINNNTTTHLEAEIDQLVYKLYDLTEEEIQIIEESVGG